MARLSDYVSGNLTHKTECGLYSNSTVFIKFSKHDEAFGETAHSAYASFAVRKIYKTRNA